MKNRIGILFLGGLFILAFILMIYYGTKAFYIPPLQTDNQDYAFHFVLIPEKIDNEYWRTVEKGARDAAEKYNVYLEYYGPIRTNIDEHIQAIEKAIASKVDGIMVQGLNEDLFVPIINKALDQGIAVITLDTDAEKSRRKSYIGSDNYQAGYLAGKALIADTKGPQYVGIVTGRKDATHQKLRIQGFQDAIAEEERIHIVGIEESKITKAGAAQATYDLLKENPRITAFYGTSALDGIGIAEVYRTLYPLSNPYIITFDALPDTLELLENGEIDAIVVQYPYQMGYLAIETLVEINRGGYPERFQYTEVGIIRKDDIEQFLQTWKGIGVDEDDPQ